MTPIMNRTSIIQNCYIVRDLEQACARMNKLYGIGPFLGGGNGVLNEHYYRGQKADPIEIRGVFVQSGDLNIELVQLVSKGPCAFSDMFPNGKEGFHHVAFFCDDYEAERDAFVAAGYPVASEFTVGFGAKICYVDARDSLGHMLELYPESDIIRGMYEQTRRAAETWDGKELIIPWA
ncbi:VOC family protein [Iodidimonas sp. SYSU 1G8]|uniref:VOC family protein n=1 Tax=Iodidimonas sp. SYSU 1G8 TaxID=3133967 RepID=UPI0031FF314C